MDDQVNQSVLNTYTVRTATQAQSHSLQYETSRYKTSVQHSLPSITVKSTLTFHLAIKHIPHRHIGPVRTAEPRAIHPPDHRGRATIQKLILKMPTQQYLSFLNQRVCVCVCV